MTMGQTVSVIWEQVGGALRTVYMNILEKASCRHGFRRRGNER